MIDRPGVYDIPAEEYHADCCPEPSLSSSIAKLLITRTPWHAHEEHPRLNPNRVREDSEKFDIGNAAHSLMLNDPKKFEIILADHWRTKVAKDKRDEARAAGKIPLLAEQWERVAAMIVAAHKQLGNHAEASDAFTNGKPEQTLIWEEDGVWLRARLDWLPNAGANFDDYKTTECASPEVFQTQIERMGHDVQCEFYRRGLRKLGICANPIFRFVTQEVDPPYALCVNALAPDFVDLAAHKVERTIDIWRTCLTSNRWPGYPRRICWIEAPKYAEERFVARDARHHESQRDLRTAYQAQAPL